MRKRNVQISLFVALFVYAVVVVRSAWLMDDAFITFRTVDNFINGYGLTWNTTERVQAYTNPLWMFLVSAVYFFTQEIFYTPLYLSIAVSVAGVGLVAWRLAATPFMALIGLSVIANSKAFIDYSTSGLENPLTHIVIVVFAWQLFQDDFDKGGLFRLAFIGSLSVVNRMDSILLFLPAILYVASQSSWRKAVYLILLGFIPFLLWEMFSLFYYGFLFPNTAYAKLNTGLSRFDLIAQGLTYILDSLRTDPLTMLTIAASISGPFFLREKRQCCFAIGIALYVAYIVYIGGDFMTGRFLSAPFIAAVAVIVSRDRIPTIKGTVISIAVVLTLALSSNNPPLLSGADYGLGGVSSRDGIADERAAYYQNVGLLPAWRSDPIVEYPDHEWARGAKMVRPNEGQYGVVVWANVGLTGFYSGPNLHVVDPIGLSDPLLARLPPYQVDDWAIGHMRRVIPEGYYETLLYDENYVVDDSLAVYVNKLHTVTRGELLDVDRLVEVWRINVGQYDHLVDQNTYRNPPWVYRLISDAYEEPKNPIVHLQLAEEQLKRGNTYKGMNALRAALQLKREIFLERMQESELSRTAWAGYLRQHLETASEQLQLKTHPVAGHSTRQNNILDEYDVFAHYTWIYSTLRNARAFAASGDSTAAAIGREEAIAHSASVLSVQSDGSIYHLLGIGLQRNGRLQEAVSAFGNSISHSTNKDHLRQSYRDLASVLMLLGDETAASEALQSAAALDGHLRQK